ncbi:DUF6537 domain-containing protein [Tardiphaga sp. P9-11]|uniref:DUF6537 domain-containing protein n=1 Tax=Tardiphaga sp. P9-11 TaxID=2024614 RepID=UPI0011F3AB7A|nr:DUF6537 domain-containing protein [Tardiphaga sp. P9-11]KAA0075034.1 hypothetical protein CIW50_13115 [Tardiphaga sp. P9-11]
MAAFTNVIRSTIGEIAGIHDVAAVQYPAGLPGAVRLIAEESVALLIDYQSPAYAQLYCDRLRRFVGKRGLDDGLFAEIARLLTVRMSYLDPIRIAQLKLQEPVTPGRKPVVDKRRFRLDELVSSLPEIVGDPALWVLERIYCAHRTIPIRFSKANVFSVKRLAFEAWLRHWRRLSTRYEMERVWVERWLHMIDRALTRRPDAVEAVVRSATMIEGYGTGYRQGMAAWHQIVDGLAKPAFDGTLVIADLAEAIMRARTVPRDPKGDQLRKAIGELRAHAVMN